MPGAMDTKSRCCRSLVPSRIKVLGRQHREMLGRILICDDSLITRHLLSRLCDRLGLFRWDVAEDGPSAVAKCSAIPYELVLMDELDVSGRFGWSGLTTAALIRSLCPPLCSPRLVLMTVRPFSELSLEALFSAGIDDVLRKPWLEGMVKRMLSGDHKPRLFHHC